MYGFTRLQFSMTKEFWWNLCRARIERRDTGDSVAQFSYRQENVELPAIVFHHIESFGLPFTLEDVCCNLCTDFQQITNKLQKWRHPTDGILIEPQVYAVILGRARRLFRLCAQERNVELRFADVVDSVCQAFVHNHIRHVSPFPGFARDPELASCALFAVISNHLVERDGETPVTSSASESRLYRAADRANQIAIEQDITIRSSRKQVAFSDTRTHATRSKSSSEERASECC
jgi:hypothetical protein